MPSHSEQQHSPYAPEQLFDLVADIEKYPEFLPWCQAARILERGEGVLVGELVIRFAHLTESYVSRVTLDRPHGIDVALMRGPFSRLANRWRFSPAPDGGTLIDFSLDFEFRSKLLERMIGPLFAKAAARMAGAFKERANRLYGVA